MEVVFSAEEGGQRQRVGSFGFKAGSNAGAEGGHKVGFCSR